jgi:hypothetical protein
VVGLRRYSFPDFSFFNHDKKRDSAEKYGGTLLHPVGKQFVFVRPEHEERKETGKK